MAIEKIISGGQTGADIAGLRWARKNGVPTGGYIPKGFRTESGYKTEYATKITDNWFSFTTKKSMAKAQNMGASGMDITKLRQEYNKKPFGVSTSVREDYPKNIISNTIHGYKCFVMDATELQAFKDNWETYKTTLKCRSNPIVTYKETKELAKYLNSKRRYEWVFEVDPNIN